MAYSPDTLRKLMSIPNVFNLWVYHSADTDATINTSGYFGDGTNSRGFNKGDVVIHVIPSTGAVSFIPVSTVGGTVDVFDGLALGTTNTD